MTHHPVIAIVGTPGTGKTFLVEKLVSKMNAIYIKEPTLLPRIIENLGENKRNLETIIYFLEQGMTNMKLAIEQKTSNIVIMDTYWMSTMLYIDSLLDTFESNVLRSFMSHLESSLPIPDIVIWLTAKDNNIIDNVHERDRAFEQSKEYTARILSIKEAHKAHFTEAADIIVDKTNIDFSEDTALDNLISTITEKIMLLK